MSAARSLLHCCFARRTTGLASPFRRRSSGRRPSVPCRSRVGPPCCAGRGRPETAGNPDVPADRIPYRRTIRTRDGCAGPCDGVGWNRTPGSRRSGGRTHTASSKTPARPLGDSRNDPLGNLRTEPREPRDGTAGPPGMTAFSSHAPTPRNRARPARNRTLRACPALRPDHRRPRARPPADPAPDPLLTPRPARIRTTSRTPPRTPCDAFAPSGAVPDRGPSQALRERRPGPLLWGVAAPAVLAFSHPFLTGCFLGPVSAPGLTPGPPAP